MTKTAVLVSGGGATLQALLDLCYFEELPGLKIAAVISSAPGVYALERAENAHVPAYVVERALFPNNASFCNALLERGFGIVTGGTDCHMFVADLRPFGTDCERLADVMQDVGITVNTKGIPYDDSPKARGLRAGRPS